MIEKFIVVHGVLRYSCFTQQELDQYLRQCEENGVKEVIVYRGEIVKLPKEK